jgi:tellurite resistance protein
MSEAEALEELLLLDSRVLGTSNEYYLDRLRRLNIVHSDLLGQFAGLLSETRVCAGRVIQLARILTNEIINIIESEPDLPSGPQLNVSLHVLIEFVPFLAPLLATIVSEATNQGYGDAVAATGFMEDLKRKGSIFFRRFADILNLNREFLVGQTSVNLDSVSFEQSSMFELDTADNPFDLDDLSSISPATQTVVKFLVKIALSKGKLSDEDKQFIGQVLSQIGESMTQPQFEQLAADATREPLTAILKPVENQTELFKERLLLAGMLVTATDGHVEKIEKKMLAQSLPALNVSRERYSEIAKDALTLIRAGRLNTQGVVTAGAPTGAAISSSAPRSLTTGEASAISDPVAPQPPDPGPPASPPVQKEIVPPPNITSYPTQAPIPDRSPITAPQADPEAQGAPDKQTTAVVWRCPACHMPQFKAYDECPQCGVIVSKFYRQHPQEVLAPFETEYIDVPPDDPIDQKAIPPSTPSLSEPRAPEAAVCQACGEALIPGAKFCTSCGCRVP